MTGTITWPDGNPAASTQVFWYAGGYNSASASFESQIPADGSYSLSGCPCSPLVGYLHVPPPSQAWPVNKDRDCWIILKAHGTYSRITAHPGEVINWQALNIPCATGPYRSSPSDVQSEIQLLNAAMADPMKGRIATAGTWQDAENRTSGCS